LVALGFYGAAIPRGGEALKEVKSTLADRLTLAALGALSPQRFDASRYSGAV
jgi:hypothetical protein